MARPLNILTTRKVSALSAPGRHADGGGLYLRITDKGSRSWVFMTATAGKRIEVGLGAASAVPLAAARMLAAKMREAVALGTDPRSVITEAGEALPPAVLTFGEFAETYIADVEAGWKSAVHRQQWRNSLRDHARALLTRPLPAIGTDEILEVVRPIWLTKPETARRVRGRIEKILDAAKARGLRPRDSMNPAAWRGHMALLLPSQAQLSRGHHPALPWREAPKFYAELKERGALAARCLQFVILTAARTGEALGARWGEIDLEAELWTLPPERMKARVEHSVPLSPAAVALLTSIQPKRVEPLDPVFGIAGAARSNMAMAMLLRRMGRGDITVHGFRSTFRDWAGEETEYPRELIEHALAHVITSKAERAYRRETAVARRRPLMASWAAYLEGHNQPAGISASKLVS